MSRPIVITDATFLVEVERCPTPVLIGMWASCCVHSAGMADIVEALAAEMAGRVRVATLNVQDNPATVARFNVRGVPTLLALDGGREIGRIVGPQPKYEVVRRLQTIFG